MFVQSVVFLGLKEYFSPLQENFKPPRHSSPIASDVKIRTSLSVEALQARDNDDPNKGSEYEIKKTHGRLPLLFGEKFSDRALCAN